MYKVTFTEEAVTEFYVDSDDKDYVEDVAQDLLNYLEIDGNIRKCQSWTTTDMTVVAATTTDPTAEIFGKAKVESILGE